LNSGAVRGSARLPAVANYRRQHQRRAANERELIIERLPAPPRRQALKK
jgi:hypothetical protein